MAKKTSANAKAAYGRYESEGRAAKNKAARAVRHSKRHPNDVTTGGRGGRTQDMDNRPTALDARINRAVAHEMLFGQGKEVKGRDLSSASARKAFLAPAKKAA